MAGVGVSLPKVNLTAGGSLWRVGPVVRAVYAWALVGEVAGSRALPLPPLGKR